MWGKGFMPLATNDAIGTLVPVGVCLFFKLDAYGLNVFGATLYVQKYFSIW